MASGLLDTSVVIDWHDPAALAALPDEVAVSAITAAELAAGPHLASTPGETAKRQSRLQEVEASLEPIPFDGAAVRSYGLVVAAAAATDASRAAAWPTCSSQPRHMPTASICTRATAMTSSDSKI